MRPTHRPAAPRPAPPPPPSRPAQALRSELACVRGAACTAAEGWERLRHERNQHRLHHKRLAQEKERLLLDAKRLRLHYAQVRACSLSLASLTLLWAHSSAP